MTVLPWFVFAFLSAIFVGVGTILNKKILTHEHALEFTASRGIFFLFFILFLIPFIDLNLPLTVYLFVYFISILVSAGLLFLMKSIRHGEVSSVAPLMNISPLFLLIIAFFFLGEKPETLQYMGVFLLIFGAYALEVGIANGSFTKPLKVFAKSKIIHFLVFAMIIFSITATFEKMIIGSQINVWTYIFLITIFKTINFTALEVYKNGFQEIVKNVKKDFKLLAADSIFIFFGQMFYFIAVSIPTASISLIIPIKRMSTLFTTIFGGKIFHEENLLIKVLAGIIMIWGAVFILLP